MTSQESFIPQRPQVKIPSWVETCDYRVVKPENAVEAFRELAAAEVVAWDSEFQPLHTGHKVSAFSFSTKEGTGWMIPIRMVYVPNVDLSLAKKFIKAISLKRNVTQMGRAEMRSVKGTWPEDWEQLVNITDDIAVEWYLKDPNEAKDFETNKPAKRGAPQPQGFALGPMALKYLKLETPDLGDFFKKQGGDFAELAPDLAVPYSCSDADVTLRLHNKAMDDQLRHAFSYRLDMEVIPVLLDMEMRGIVLDPEELSRVEKDVRRYLAETRAVAYEALNMDDSVNIDSPTQLARHIYGVLGWPVVGKRRKDGLGSTDKNAMSRHSESADPARSKGADAVRKYKRWQTLHNNFLTKLHEYVNPHTNAIHCSFKSTVVPTGRLACGQPNMQQIPRNKQAPARRAFKPRAGRLFLEVDYSQIELRVYAGESGESYLNDAFMNGEDLHLKTASIIYREQITDKNDERRQMGKTMNFGPIYGMKAEGLALRTDYSVEEAQQILDDFFSAMPDATRWASSVIALAKQQGGVHTHFQRWRPLPWLHSRQAHVVEFGERSAINTIVQGTAADIMKIGLIRLWKALRKHPVYKSTVELILTIHDSVLMEFDKDLDVADLCDFISLQMCFPVKGYPPIEVDFKVGANWNDMEEVEGVVEVAPQTDRITREVPVPKGLSDEAYATFYGLVKNAARGEADVTFLMGGGKGFGPFSMTLQHYQTILNHLVLSAREGGDTNGNTSSPTSLRQVSFN